ncbi:hypothetical protein D9619_001280 [Psilocybe cf. subviscida]|uniref:J domain-containing protein n=1 Tax=Psilocybe cf. subviscida TaxID=2480587 RepID=A0A8H5BGE7_9AGAR|nr:hypothetical protein D9619_001280 [Psilocybe cf. subviscida]
MAAYEYDEAGVMAAYFIITFLALVLVPLTISSLTKSSAKPVTDGCQCKDCVEQRKLYQKQEKGSIFAPKISRKSYLLLGGWSLFAFVCYRVSQLKTENKIYNPFEILGIKSSTPDKEIKAHFKQLSRQFHPDKVKVTANLTIEAIQERFVDLTKAYKSLTDERIKENWIKYNHPDGPQSTSMGIALPKWLIEGQNRIWVLAAYALVFGGALPALVGRWWFGSRDKTKDGVNANSAAAFFKTMTEESTTEQLVAALGKAYKWELPPSKSATMEELRTLEETISEKLGAQWTEVKKLAKDHDGSLHASRRTALVLIYAHLLRLDINDITLKKQQKEVLLQTPLLLNALLNVAIARTWLSPTLVTMRLSAYLAQALPPITTDRLRFGQLPGLKHEEIETVAPEARSLTDVLSALEEKDDPRAVEVKKALDKWAGKVDIVDATFRVIGEKIVTPSSIIYLLVKLRLTPPGAPTQEKEKKELTVEETKRAVVKDEEFLGSRLEADEIKEGRAVESAHAPFWPGNRKPSWWIVLADDKTNRIVVPPMKISDIPYANPEADGDKDYRSYKVQFQGPPNTGLFTWKVYIVSDTFIGEEASVDIQLKIEDPPAIEQISEDDISDPDEDSLAGQMAAMRGGTVKKHDDDESDEESGTDDDKKDDSSDSDSDSD